MTGENPSGRRPGARSTLLSAIEDHDDDPAPVVDVVEEGLVEHDPTAVFEAFADLIRHGEVYEAEPNAVRRTSR
jgi:hypothetical protein